MVVRVSGIQLHFSVICAATTDPVESISQVALLPQLKAWSLCNHAYLHREPSM